MSPALLIQKLNILISKHFLSAEWENVLSEAVELIKKQEEETNDHREDLTV